MKRQKDRATITVLHDLNLVQEYADKVILLSNGKMHSYGSTKDILTNDALEEVYRIDIKKWMTNVLVKWEA